MGAANLERGVWSIVLWQARDRFQICNSSESENVFALLDGCSFVGDGNRLGPVFGILVAWTIGGFLLCSTGDFQGCSFSNSVLERKF